MRPRHAMKVSIPDTVLSTELHDEGVLLNLETGEYYGLDAVGMDMWKALRDNGDVAAACASCCSSSSTSTATRSRATSTP